MARINDKEGNARRKTKKRKGIEAQRVKPSTPSWAIDALIGEEEQNGNRKNKETERDTNQAPWII